MSPTTGQTNAVRLNPAALFRDRSLYVYAPVQLQQLLDAAITSDANEEDATDFLDDHGIPYFTHNRQFLIALAYRNGWRPHS